MTELIWRKGPHTALLLHLPVAQEFREASFSTEMFAECFGDEAQHLHCSKITSDKWSPVGQQGWLSSLTAWDESPPGTSQPPAWEQLCLQQSAHPGNRQHFLVPQTGLFTTFWAMPFVSCANRGAPSVHAMSGELLNEPAITQKC